MIKASLSVNGNHGPTGPIVVAGNTVAGNVSVTNNHVEIRAGGILVGFNTVTGILTCSDNNFFFAAFNTAPAHAKHWLRVILSRRWRKISQR